MTYSASILPLLDGPEQTATFEPEQTAAFEVERVTAFEVERVTIHTPAATIEGPACVGPVRDAAAVKAAVLRWAGSVYAGDPVKRAWIDAHVLQAPAGMDAHVVQGAAKGDA